MITIVLHGKLGERFVHPRTGNRWRLNVVSPAQALNALDVINKGDFFGCIASLESEMQGYHVQIDEADVSAEHLALLQDDAVVTITPLLQGCDTKGVIQIVAGVALIAVGLLAAYGTFGSSLFVTGLGLQVVGLGLAVALGGVARLLMTAPEHTLGTQDKSKSSYVFTGIVNTIQQGECVPVTYGNPWQGSGVVAAGLESEDVNG
jgi:predicted phage tail protein